MHTSSHPKQCQWKKEKKTQLRWIKNPINIRETYTNFKIGWYYDDNLRQMFLMYKLLPKLCERFDCYGESNVTVKSQEFVRDNPGGRPPFIRPVRTTKTRRPILPFFWQLYLCYTTQNTKQLAYKVLILLQPWSYPRVDTQTGSWWGVKQDFQQ